MPDEKQCPVKKFGEVTSNTIFAKVTSCLVMPGLEVNFSIQVLAEVLSEEVLSEEVQVLSEMLAEL